MFLDTLIVNFIFQNPSNSFSVYSKSREVAAVYTKQLRMKVSGSTNCEFQIPEHFQFMFSIFKIQRSGSCVYKTAENECFWIH